jgi:hypothetical protein
MRAAIRQPSPSEAASPGLGGLLALALLVLAELGLGGLVRPTLLVPLLGLQPLGLDLGEEHLALLGHGLALLLLGCHGNVLLVRLRD